MLGHNATKRHSNDRLRSNKLANPETPTTGKTASKRTTSNNNHWSRGKPTLPFRDDDSPQTGRKSSRSRTCKCLDTTQRKAVRATERIEEHGRTIKIKEPAVNPRRGNSPYNPFGTHVRQRSRFAVTIPRSREEDIPKQNL